MRLEGLTELLASLSAPSAAGVESFVDRFDADVDDDDAVDSTGDASLLLPGSLFIASSNSVKVLTTMSLMRRFPRNFLRLKSSKVLVGRDGTDSVKFSNASLKSGRRVKISCNTVVIMPELSKLA